MKDLLTCVNQNISLNADIEGNNIQELTQSINYLIEETKLLSQDTTSEFFGIPMTKDHVSESEVRKLLDDDRKQAIKYIIIAGTKHYKSKCVYIIRKSKGNR